MKLYLQDKNQKRTDKIELVRGCFPTITANIDGFESNHSHCVKQLEPAVWSLLLIVNEIRVDCSKREFSWTTTGDGERYGNEDVLDDSYNKNHFVEDGCYEYNDDVDQLFNIAQGLIESSSLQTTISRKTPEYLNRIKDDHYSLIRMLYCYILPKIELRQKDLVTVQQAIGKQTDSIQTIDEDIEEDSKNLQKLYQDLSSQQDHHLQQFTDVLETKKCTKEFIKIFEKDLNKRINQLNEKLDEKQTIVNSIKEDISKNGETTEKNNQLAEARKETKKCHETLQGLLLVSRDTIKTTLSEDGDFLNKDTEQIVLNYLKTTEDSKREKNAAKNHMEKKVHAISMLENLLRIQKEIQNNGKASSTEVRFSGKKGTDVIDQQEIHVPEYQTLGERVSGIVKNPDHPLGEAYQKFVLAIRKQCKEILNETKIVAVQSKSKQQSAENFLVVSYDGTIQEEFLSLLQDLCRCIKNHFEVMATNLQEQFNSKSPVLKNKLQLHYEENFYNDVGKNITEVYSMAHLHHIEKMTTDLELVSKSPIDCLNLGMKEEWWLELFEKRRKATHMSRKTSLSIPDGQSSPKRLSSSSFSGSVSSLHSQSDSTRKQPASERSSRRIHRSIIHVIKRISRSVSGSSIQGFPQSDDVQDNAVRCMNGYDSPDIWPSDSPESLPSDSPDDDEPCSSESPEYMYQKELSMFEEYFGPSLECLKEVFTVAPVFSKLQCLTMSLRKVTKSVEKLRRQVLEKSNKDDNCLAITGDDILPLIVLMILQMDHLVAAALQGQLKMMQDLIPKFLSAGCHGWAMMEFEMACLVLQSLCSEYEVNGTH